MPDRDFKNYDAGRWARRPRLRAPMFIMNLAERYLPQPARQVLTDWAAPQPRRRLVEEVRAAGFIDLECSWCGQDVVFSSAEEFWEAQLAIVTEVRQRCEHAPASAMSAMRTEFLSAAQSVLKRGGDLIYSYGAFYVSARRPTSNT